MKRTELAVEAGVGHFQDHYQWKGARVFPSRPATVVSVVIEEEKGPSGTFTELVVRVEYDDAPGKPIAVYRALHDVSDDATMSNDYYGNLYDLDTYIKSNRIRNPAEINTVFSVTLFDNKDSTSPNESYIVYAITSAEAVKHAKAQSDEYAKLPEKRLGALVRGPFTAPQSKRVGTVE